jgi:hypothetical protein
LTDPLLIGKIFSFNFNAIWHRGAFPEVSAIKIDGNSLPPFTQVGIATEQSGKPRMVHIVVNEGDSSFLIP